jgi:ferredoxin-type protein NapH
MRKLQIFTVWLLPLIVIGGLSFPVLGYLVLGMMVVLLIMSFFKARFWCWNLCPRGAFLDIVLSKISRNKPLPGIFTKQWFRVLVLVLMMSFLVYRVIKTGGDLVLIGSVFVVMCIVTTIIAIVLGVITKHRAWCMICPMGYLQEKVAKLKRSDTR